MAYNSVTDIQVIEACNDNETATAVCKLLSINYETLRNRAVKLGVYKFKVGKGSKKVSLQDVFDNIKTLSSGNLKRKLIKAGLKTTACELCNWNERRESDGRVPTELHHIDGNAHNNALENLQIVCPNCHSLTDTYRSLSKKIGASD